jgi:hypothetical protein
MATMKATKKTKALKKGKKLEATKPLILRSPSSARR